MALLNNKTKTNKTTPWGKTYKLGRQEDTFDDKLAQDRKHWENK